MIQYNSFNVKLSYSQLNKLNSAIKNKTELTLRLSSNMVGDDENNYYQLIDKLKILIKLLEIIYQLILSY